MKRNLLKCIAIALLVICAWNPSISQNDLSKSKSVSIEDWETGDFSQYEWQFGGNANWLITDQNPYEGIYSARSGDINDNQTSTLFIEYEVYSPENISFWFRVSSESGWDFLRFYIDNIEVESWAGEIPWQQFSTPVSAGFHTFKWEYYKDGSLSSGADACWIDYITFPPMQLEALFTADSTVTCKNGIVYFYDQSVGPITEWNWIFEGAVPSTSTLQNPVVGYPTVGSWDVFLEVSDGVESAQLYMEAYITVGDVPGPAPKPSGITNLCASWGNTSYTTTGLPGITQYEWMIDPPEAGTISGGGTNVTVVWEDDFLGVADLMVAGINYCGVGAYSQPLTITRYLPVVTLNVPAFVSISTPPFELTGGSPSGGDYSGPGVANGIFDPEAAGLGTHIITYTYTDINLCTNSDIDSITVTQFTGILSQIDQHAVAVFPNPNNGNFRLQINMEGNDVIDLKIFNAMNKLVFEEKNISARQSFTKEFSLETLTKGVYYLHIEGKQMNLFKKVVIQ